MVGRSVGNGTTDVIVIEGLPSMVVVVAPGTTAVGVAVLAVDEGVLTRSVLVGIHAFCLDRVSVVYEQ